GYSPDVLLFREQRLTNALLTLSRHFGTPDAAPNQGSGRKSPPGFPLGLRRFKHTPRGRPMRRWFVSMRAALSHMPAPLVERILPLDIKHDGTYDSGGNFSVGSTDRGAPQHACKAAIRGK